MLPLLQLSVTGIRLWWTEKDFLSTGQLENGLVVNCIELVVSSLFVSDISVVYSQRSVTQLPQGSFSPCCLYSQLISYRLLEGRGVCYFSIGVLAVSISLPTVDLNRVIK